MKSLPFKTALAVMSVFLYIPSAQAFCGFYVAKADASLYNKASQVIIARDGDRTVLSMYNDYQGDLKDFAMVVPVPSVIKKNQVHIASSKIFKRLDDFTSPRLVEYFDEGCMDRIAYASSPVMLRSQLAPEMMKRAKDLGVKIEEQFSVGEYDILILSAKESDGLTTWLKENDYVLPKKAAPILRSYIKQGLKFFVAKVNLKKQAEEGFQYLRPLQFAYESKRFMLPIRLGTLNANNEPQDLLAYIFSRKGRVEAANYRNIKMPSNLDIPVFIKSKFKDFYRATFDTVWEKEDGKVVVTEHFWDINSCDPCSAPPLTKDELRQAGVFWWNETTQRRPLPSPTGTRLIIPAPRKQTKITRLHVRYTEASFPEDLMLVETGDTGNFQTRFVLRHPYSIKDNPRKCQADELLSYHQTLVKRREKEAQNAARLTNWNINEIRKDMGKSPEKPKVTQKKDDEWWKTLWGDNPQ